MDSITPTYPTFDPSSLKDSRNDFAESETFRQARYPSSSTNSTADVDHTNGTGSSHRVDASQSPSFGLDFAPAPAAGNLNPSSHPHDQQQQQSELLQQPYSPTRAEIEAHPIRQRLSLVGDEKDNEPEGIEEREPEREALRQEQAQEGSERLFEAMESGQPAVKEGDAVSYAWSGGRPEGIVSQVATDGPVVMETKNNNEVTKEGEPENPALYIERSGHDVVKKASEVEIEEKGAAPEKKSEPDEKKEEEEKKSEQAKPKSKQSTPLPSMPPTTVQMQNDKKESNGEKPAASTAQTGEKRAAEEPAEEKKAEEPNGEAKKQKTEEPKANGDAKKKGRPAKTDADGKPVPKKETKKKAPKKAATATGEPRRSGRVANKSS